MKLGLELLTPEVLAKAAKIANLTDSEIKSISTKSLLKALEIREKRQQKAATMAEFSEALGKGFVKGFRSLLNPKGSNSPVPVELESKSDLAFKIRLERVLRASPERPNFPRAYHHKIHCGCRSGMFETDKIETVSEQHFIPYGSDDSGKPSYYREVTSRKFVKTDERIAVPYKRHSVRCLRDKRSDRESAAIGEQFSRQSKIRSYAAPVQVLDSAKRCMDACCKGK